MTDLLDRIRNRLNDAPMPTERLLDESADEIERLRKVRDQASHLLLGLSLPMDTTTAQKELKRLVADSWTTKMEEN